MHRAEESCKKHTAVGRTQIEQQVAEAQKNGLGSGATQITGLTVDMDVNLKKKKLYNCTSNLIM